MFEVLGQMITLHGGDDDVGRSLRRNEDVKKHHEEPAVKPYLKVCSLNQRSKMEAIEPKKVRRR